MTLPLHNIRVLEFTHAVLGPAAGLHLAEFGAEVIRIERTPDGDPTRRLTGFGQGYYPMFNRNKKSLLLNLKQVEGQAIAHQLLATSDIVLENFGPGVMERLGLGYGELRGRYPRLIYCTLKGFLPGPYQERTALDEVVQMMSGLAYMTGRPGDPLRAGASIVDIMTGVYGAMGCLLALQEREKSGLGQLVQSSLFEAAAFIMGHHLAYAAMTQEPVPPMPARVSAWAIYHQFPTADGQRIFVGVTSDQQWVRFCHAFDRPDWLADERLQTNQDRIAQRQWFLPQVEAMMAQYPLAEIIIRCEAANLPFSPIARPEDLFDDPQLNDGGSLQEVALPDGRFAKLPHLPLRLNHLPGPLRGHPPTPGQHTRELLYELGYSEQTIVDLETAGVVGWE
ncbi:MAG: CoA transferase [Anaerolineae bacterium]|nr:CoA transferase [Anaerolineae bacterium]